MTTQHTLRLRHRIERPSVWTQLRSLDPVAADGIASLARYWHIPRARLVALVIAAAMTEQRPAVEAIAAQMAEAALARRRPHAYRRALTEARERIAAAVAACRADGLTDPDAILARVQVACPPPGLHDWPTLAWQSVIRDLEHSLRFDHTQRLVPAAYCNSRTACRTA